MATNNSCDYAPTQYNVQVGGASGTLSSVAPSATSGIPLVSNGAASNPSFTTAVVAGGGTGKTSLTAYAVLCGGTTSTAAIQSIASVGSSGQVLTSNGAGALPTFQAASGGITTINGDSGSVTGSTITITGSTSGAVFTGAGTTLTESFNYLALPSTTSGGNGVITLGTVNTLHTGAGTSMIFVGRNSGNLANGGNALNIVGVGTNAYNAMTFASDGVAVGYSALSVSATGNHNVAVGSGSLDQLNGGGDNTCIGYHAGHALTTNNESNNIYIGSGVVGVVSESSTIRIGVAANVNTCFIAGITGATVTGSAVLCSATGLLGTVVSSLRYKNSINPLDMHDKFMELNPVSFQYNKDDIPGSIHFGLIAEEVEKVIPELVIYDEQNRPESVEYHELPAILISEIQKLCKRIEILEEKLKEK